ncbi:sulfite reductase [Corynebacterium renale]|nr:sulfite reductase [Corynebacterium renale]
MAVTTRRRPRAKKSDGQWKVDGRTPLNHDEEVKQEQEVLQVYDRIVNIYSKQGFASIPADDLAPRFKWLGIYTQRRQDLGTEFTGQDNAVLQDQYFMMRVRFDGGRVTPEQLRVVGEISREYARSTADFTDRQNIQLHWLRIEDIPAIFDKLDAVGLSPLLGCGDVPRVILGSPVAGVAADEIIDATPPSKRSKKSISSTRSSITCPANLSPPSPATPARTSPTKFRTWPSSDPFTRSTARASSASSVAACPPIRCSAIAWAPGSHLRRSRRCGPACSASSAITVSAACATGHA